MVSILHSVCCAQTEDTVLKEKIAQLLIVGFRGTELTADNHIYHDVKNLHVGGIILFDYDVPSKSRTRNITSPAQLKKLIADITAIAPPKLIVSIDQEGGRVNRLKANAGFPATVSARYLGQVDHVDTTVHYAAQTARTLAELGVNLNFAPCVDLDVNPQCPVIGKVERSFSAHPETVVKHARIWIAELRKHNIIACPKHFPGHGSSHHDSHAGGADVTNTWTDEELTPYRALIENNALPLIMTSHVFNANLDADYPATLSKKILTGILRERLGFDGVIVSDDLAMGAIADHYALKEALEKALNAGVDMLCLSNNGNHYDPQIAQKAIDAIYASVKEGRLPVERINEAYQRIMKLKQQL